VQLPKLDDSEASAESIQRDDVSQSWFVFRTLDRRLVE
jgi:hypothetical protein